MDEGLGYMRSSQAVYDLIVLDLTDPGGPSWSLHTADFYRHCAARLNPGGLLSLQVASPVAQPERVASTLTALTKAFSTVRPCMVSVALSGGQWITACASHSLDPAELSVGQVDTVIRSRKLRHLQHHNGHTHQAAMALPNFVRDMVAPTSALWMSRI